MAEEQMAVMDGEGMGAVIARAQANTFITGANAHTRSMERLGGMFDRDAFEASVIESHASRYLNTGQPNAKSNENA